MSKYQKRKTFDKLRKEVRSAESIERVERHVEKELLAMDLKAMREMLGLTQKQVAELTEMTQPAISMIEGREDYKLSTLRRMVIALGGRLDVVAIFGDKSIRLRTTGELG